MKLDIKIEIPESINDIKLWHWQKYMSIVKEDADVEFANRKALEIFYGIDGKHYTKLKVKDIDKIVSVLSDALREKPTLVTRFVLNDIEYGFIPDFDDMTFGEFVDLDKYSNIKDYHKLMSILFRPIINDSKGKYAIASYEGSNELLKDMPLGITLSATAFFLTIALQLTRGILKSSMVTEPILKQKQDLVLSGLGILQSTPLPMEAYLNLKM